MVFRCACKYSLHSRVPGLDLVFQVWFPFSVLVVAYFTNDKESGGGLVFFARKSASAQMTLCVSPHAHRWAIGVGLLPSLPGTSVPGWNNRSQVAQVGSHKSMVAGRK